MSEPVRVAYLIGRYPWLSHTFIRSEISALRELGAEVSTFSIWPTPPEQLVSADDRREFERTHALLPPRRAAFVGQLHALRHTRAYATLLEHALSLGPPGARRLLLGASWVVEAVSLWDALRRTDVRHVHAHLGGTAPAVAMLTADLGNAEGDEPWTWSFTVHGPDEFADVVRERLRAKIEAASFVVAISDYTRSQLLALVDESNWSKVHVVHCGIDPDVFAPSTNGHGSKQAALDVLTVGRLSAAKGHGVFLQAIARLAAEGVTVRATIVGDGPLRAQLDALAASLGIRDAVTFAGALGHEHLPQQYAAADVVCAPSFAEGLPVVLMEAMATGKPVVATAVMGIPELVLDGETGLLVRPGRPDLLASALRRLAGDAGLRERLGTAARARVAAEHDNRHEARRLLDLFVQHAGRPT